MTNLYNGDTKYKLFKKKIHINKELILSFDHQNII